MTILTAAHCIVGVTEIIKDYFVEAGITSGHLSKTDGLQGQTVPIQSFTLHPDFRLRKSTV